MSVNLDRFSQGLPDQQEAEVFDHCEECGEEIYEGQRVTRYEGDLFCNDRCLFNKLGAVTITAGEY